MKVGNSIVTPGRGEMTTFMIKGDLSGYNPLRTNKSSSSSRQVLLQRSHGASGNEKGKKAHAGYKRQPASEKLPQSKISNGNGMTHGKCRMM